MLRGRSCPLATSVRITCAPSATRTRKRSFKAAEVCILALGMKPLVPDLVNSGAAQLCFGIAGLEPAEQGAGLRQAGERERSGAVETAFVELMGGRSREGGGAHLYAPE